MKVIEIWRWRRRWCRARDSFRFQIPVTTGVLELRTCCIHCGQCFTASYTWFRSRFVWSLELMIELNLESRSWKVGSKLKYCNIYVLPIKVHGWLSNVIDKFIITSSTFDLFTQGFQYSITYNRECKSMILRKTCEICWEFFFRIIV